MTTCAHNAETTPKPPQDASRAHTVTAEPPARPGNR